MRHMTANTVQKDFSVVVDDVTRYQEPVTIVSDDNKTVVVVGMEEWKSIQETLYLTAVPGLVNSIKEAASEPLCDGIEMSEVDFGV